MNGSLMRSLRLLAVFVVVGAIALGVNRWHASRAIDAARARSEALGLRLDPRLLALELSPEARAALLAAREVTRAIWERATARYDAETEPGEFSEERLDAFNRDEAHREAAALEFAALRFLAADVQDQPEAHVWRKLEPAARGETETSVRPWPVRLALIESLCGGARVSIAAGELERGWRGIELAAQLTATKRETDMTGASALGLFVDALHAAHVEAVAAAPDHPGRERVYGALRELDVARDARAALRREAALLLYLADSPAVTGITYRARLRLIAHDLRDRAVLHATWADIIEASELPAVADQRAALAKVQARIAELPRTYALTHMTVARALSFCELARTMETELDALLAE